MCFFLPEDIPGLMAGGGKNGEGEGETEDDDEAMETGTSDLKLPKKLHTKSPAKTPKTTPTKLPAEKTAKSPAKATGSKRSREEVEHSESPATKKRKRPVCKYGPNCYQTGSKHKEAFDHPWVRDTYMNISVNCKSA